MKVKNVITQERLDESLIQSITESLPLVARCDDPGDGGKVYCESMDGMYFMYMIPNEDTPHYPYLRVVRNLSVEIAHIVAHHDFVRCEYQNIPCIGERVFG